MSRETARRLMMERIYEGLSPKDEARLDRFIQENPDIAHEWEEVKNMHELLASVPDETVPAHLEQTILNSARSDRFKMTPNRSRNVYRYLMAAASFLVIAYLPFALWHHSPQNEVIRNFEEPKANLSDNEIKKEFNRSSSTYSFENEDRNRLESGEKSSIAHSSSRTTNHTLSITPSPQSSDSYLAFDQTHTSKEHRNMFYDRTISEAEAEELFRTGLTLYNTAFTKVGEEREAMLKSAIVFLRDLEEKCADQYQWIALSLILMADSHRALGQIKQSVETYQHMIELFPNMDTYVKQARFSIVKLLLDHEDTLKEAEKALREFEHLYPETPEFAEAALTYAEKMKTHNPESSLIWCRRITEKTSEANPAWNKAHRLAQAVDQQLADYSYIKDWWIVGPFDEGYLPMITTNNTKNNNKTNKFYDVKESFFESLNGDIIRWQRPFENEHGDVDFSQFIDSIRKNASVFAVTHIHSPKDQRVHLSFGAASGTRIWINNDLVWSKKQKAGYKRDAFSVSTQLQEGWNTLLVKVYLFRNASWEFSLRILDDAGLTIPNLYIDPLKQKSDSEIQLNDTNLLRAQLSSVKDK